MHVFLIVFGRMMKSPPSEHKLAVKWTVPSRDSVSNGPLLTLRVTKMYTKGAGDNVNRSNSLNLILNGFKKQVEDQKERKVCINIWKN